MLRQPGQIAAARRWCGPSALKPRPG
jgi:hypothetical protein